MNGSGIQSRYTRVFAAVTVAMIWFKLLFFLRGFKTTGALVRMILQVEPSFELDSFTARVNSVGISGIRVFAS